MIRAQGAPIVQLRLELAESAAPAAALWELVGESERQAAMALLAALIAQAVSGEAVGDERASLAGAPVGGAGAAGGRRD
jgi:hypothetical protein